MRCDLSWEAHSQWRCIEMLWTNAWLVSPPTNTTDLSWPIPLCLSVSIVRWSLQLEGSSAKSKISSVICWSVISVREYIFCQISKKRFDIVFNDMPTSLLLAKVLFQNRIVGLIVLQSHLASIWGWGAVMLPNYIKKNAAMTAIAPTCCFCICVGWFVCVLFILSRPFI